MIRFVVNPTAGRGKAGRALARLRELARQADADLVVSRDADDLADLGWQAVRDGVERLVVAGGDGTFHHVAQGLVGSNCALGLVPLGRGNDLAGALGIVRNTEAAVEIALHMPPRHIDVGRLRERFFLGYCGMGFDSEAARFAQRAPSFLGGTVAYVYAVLRTLVSFQPPDFLVEGASERFRGPAMFVVACNISRFGGGMRIAPVALCDDGRLDLVIAEKLSRIELIRALPLVYRGEHGAHPAVHFDRVSRIRVSADRALSLACDGELFGSVGREGVEISIAAGALQVIAPNDAD